MTFKNGHVVKSQGGKSWMYDGKISPGGWSNQSDISANSRDGSKNHQARLAITNGIGAHPDTTSFTLKQPDGATSTVALDAMTIQLIADAKETGASLCLDDPPVKKTVFSRLGEILQ